MSWPKLVLIILLILTIGAGAWLFYARIIKNPATTYQRGETFVQPTYHYDYHPVMGFGCMRIPDDKKPDKSP